MKRGIYTLLCTLVIVSASPLASARVETAPSSALGKADTAVASAIGPMALHLNPAGMAQVRQYAMEVGYNFLEDGPGHVLVASAVDSKTNPALAMGVSYAHIFSEQNGRDRDGFGVRAGLGTGYRNQSFGFSLGVSGYMLKLTRGLADDEENEETDDIDNISMDAGVILEIMQRFRMGFVARNLFHTDDARMLEEPNAEKSLGVGLAAGVDMLELSVDADFGVNEKWTDVRVGAQYLLMGAMVLRLGASFEDVENVLGQQRKDIAFGVGYVSPVVAADLGMRLPLDDNDNVVFSAGVRYFLP